MKASPHKQRDSVASALTKQCGDRRWDLFLRSTGVFALLSIPSVILLPRLIPLVWLAVLSIPATGPLSPIFPTSFEPLIMEAAKYERAIWVTLVALGVYLYTEYLNWHIYAWVLDRRIFANLREHRWTRRSVDYFARVPFLTVVFFALAPLPFWVVRSIAILDCYSLRSFMIATAIGRFPRLFAYAWLGALIRFPTSILVVAMFGSPAAIVVYRLIRGKRVLADTVLDMEEAPTNGVNGGSP